MFVEQISVTRAVAGQRALAGVFDVVVAGAVTELPNTVTVSKPAGGAHG